MPHKVELISTIAVGLAFAFAGGFAAVRLRLPPIVGYLLAGVAIGPYTPGFVADTHLAPQLAEIGVMLLMFGVGMHFSIRDLLAVRRIAVPGAIGQIIVATALGLGISQLWGASIGAGILFGLALSVASTVVMLRALEERGMLGAADGRIAIGWLIVEDLVMVGVLVVIPALAAVPGGGPVSIERLVLSLALTFAKAAAFIALMLVAGTRVMPWLLREVVRTGSRELFTLAVVAAALSIAFVGSQLFDVSFALGAFFAGIVVNESDHSHKAAEQAKPLEDAFAVLFFLSVGMLFDPAILARHPFHVLAVIMLGKSLAAFLIVRGSGYSAATALTVSASLAQIGEFSFIVAALGIGQGLMSRESRNLILAGAIISITLNPAAFRLAGVLRRGFARALPAPAASAGLRGAAGGREHC